jgi:phosphoglycerate dehydrogenase-like enzyme
MTTTIAIASYLEPEHVERIAAVADDVRVEYHPDLIAPPRHGADHTGHLDFQRDAEQERRFREILGSADVHYDVDRSLMAELPTIAPKLRWIQSTSSGIGPMVKAAGLDRTDIVITNAAGIHAVPLGEHVLLSLLYFVKGVPARLADQRGHIWKRYTGRELRGRTVVVVGLGAVGREIARLCRAIGLHVIGVRRSPVTDPLSQSVDEAVHPAQLHDVLPRADALVLCCPHTPETENMIDAKAFAALPDGAILINIGRGALVVEPAMLDALRSGRLGGAALDVAAVEPLPVGHPLWDLPNVFITAHSASTVDKENGRLTDLFIDNLKRYRAGEPLRNVVSY